MNRGFVTLATGNEFYFKMAATMLRSFKLHNPSAKMAILCDKENEYTAQFDDVVVLNNTNGNYKDKFRLLIDCPYEENIFIEPDCIVYNNLDHFWELLAKESDYSSFGWNDSSLNIWFKTDESLAEIKKLLPQIEKFPLFNPGYFFIRNSEGCQKMYQDCLEISEYIMNNDVLKNDKKIISGKNLRDDPVLSLAMEINGFICNAKPSVGKCISLPSKYKILAIDVEKGVLNVRDKKGKVFENCSVLHFSTRKAKEEGLYPWQKTIIDMIYNKKSKFLRKLINTKLVMKLFDFYMLIKRHIKI